jgi:hypothetical protein
MSEYVPYLLIVAVIALIGVALAYQIHHAE